MAFIQNNITFNNLSKVGIGSPFGNVVKDGITSEEDLKIFADAFESTGESDYDYRNIQSVLIDWNGAQVSGKTLNTTGEVLSLINDNNTDIENVASSLQNHSHSNYATKSSVLGAKNYTDTTLNYNLLVAPEGTKYTSIGSLDGGNNDWTSDLWASVDNDGYTTLYSSKFSGELIGEYRHSHANYATLDVKEYTEDTDTSVLYNLLVAPEGSKYTEIGSINTGNDEWYSKLYASPVNNKVRLYSDVFVGDLPHSHANYATTSHGHSNYVTSTSIESLQTQIADLTSRITELEELVGGGSNTVPEINGIDVKVTGGEYGTNGMITTLDSTTTFKMHQFSDGTSDQLNFALTASPSNAGATLTFEYDTNNYNDVNDTLLTVSKSQITNGLNVTIRDKGSEEWSDGDYAKYLVKASNTSNEYQKMITIELSYVYIYDEYFYVGQDEPTSGNYMILATSYEGVTYPETVEYEPNGKNYAYILVKDTYRVTNIVDSNGVTIDFSQITSEIEGYKLYRTDEGIDVKITIAIS